jgi:AcrR family transcriptional regulator
MSLLLHIADQIAERAGVSRRTFFYYFSSKAEILFTVTPDNLAALTDLVAAQPAELSDLDATERPGPRSRNGATTPPATTYVNASCK